MNATLIFFLYVITLVTSELNIIVKRHINNGGFHRELITSVEVSEFSHTKIPDECNLAIHQELPSGIYVDPDQLNELNIGIKPFSNVYYLNVETVDIEASKEVSPGLDVTIMSSRSIVKNDVKPDIVETPKLYKFLLPIHVRYHAPLNGGGYKNISIPKSTLLLWCPCTKYVELRGIIEKLTPWDYNVPINAIKNGVSELCNDWYKITYNVTTSLPVSDKVKEIQDSSISQDELLIYVPVGDLDYTFFVQWITFITTNIAAVYITYTILNKTKQYQR